MSRARPYEPGGSGGGTGSGGGLSASDIAGLISDPQISGSELSFEVRGATARTSLTLPAAMGGAGAVQYVAAANLTSTGTTGTISTSFLTIHVGAGAGFDASSPPADGTALLFFSPAAQIASGPRVQISIEDGTNPAQVRDMVRADGSALAAGDLAQNQLLLVVYRSSGGSRWVSNIVEPGTATSPTPSGDSTLIYVPPDRVTVTDDTGAGRSNIIINPATPHGAAEADGHAYLVGMASKGSIGFTRLAVLRGGSSGTLRDVVRLSGGQTVPGDIPGFSVFRVVYRDAGGGVFRWWSDISSAPRRPQDIADALNGEALLGRTALDTSVQNALLGQSGLSDTTVPLASGNISISADQVVYRDETDDQYKRGLFSRIADATTSQRGWMSAAQASKLAGIESGATAGGGLSQAQVDDRIELLESTQRLYYTRSASVPDEPDTSGATTSGTPMVVQDSSFPRTGGTWYRNRGDATGDDPLYALHLTTLTYPDGSTRVFPGSPARYADPDATGGDGGGGTVADGTFVFRELATRNYSVTGINLFAQPLTPGNLPDPINLSDLPDVFGVSIESGRVHMVRKSEVRTTATVNGFSNAFDVTFWGIDGSTASRSYLAATSDGNVLFASATVSIDPGPLRFWEVTVRGVASDPAALSFTLVGEANYQTTADAANRPQFVAATDPANDIDIRGVGDVFAVRVEEHEYALMDRDQVLGYTKSVGDNSFRTDDGTAIDGVPAFGTPAPDDPRTDRTIALAWDSANNRLLVSAESSVSIDQPMPLRVYSLSGDVPDGAVRYDAAQTLDATQQNQARTNIGAISLAEIPTQEDSGVVRHDREQTLSDNAQQQARENINAAEADTPGSGNLITGEVQQVWAAHDVRPLLIAGTIHGEGFSNEVPGGDVLARAYASRARTTTNPLPARVGSGGYIFRELHADSFRFRHREWPDRLLVAWTMTAAALPPSSTEQAWLSGEQSGVDSQWTIYLDAGGILRFRTGTSVTQLSTAAFVPGTEVRVAAYFQRESAGQYVMRVACSHESSGQQPRGATINPVGDLELDLTFGCRHESNSEWNAYGEMRDIFVAIPDQNLSVSAVGPAVSDLEQVVDSGNTAIAKYDYLSRVTPHAIEGATPHSNLRVFDVSGQSVGANASFPTTISVPVNTDAAEELDFAQLEVLDTTPGGNTEQLEVERLVGNDVYLEGALDSFGRATFDRSGADGTTMRLRLRNNGPTTLTGFEARIQAFEYNIPGEPVDALPNGAYVFERGRYFWFPRHYHLSDIDRVLIVHVGGQQDSAVLAGTQIAVSTDEAANLGTALRGGDWRIWGWSGEGANFQIWGGGSTGWNSTAWSIIRPVRAATAQAGTWGGLYCPDHAATPGRRLLRVRLYPKRGVIL